ncbi:MAG: hypothetical protein JXR72_04195 [Proteobacteria bacterium]|nr:hypothetical protein [Pseudomonadota bacterium]
MMKRFWKYTKYTRAAFLVLCAGLLCSCWGSAEVYYGDPYYYDPRPPDYVGTYRLLGFDVDYYDYYDPNIYLGSEYEGDFYDFWGELRVGSYSITQKIYVRPGPNDESELYFEMEDDYTVYYTDPPYEGVFDFYYNNYGIYDYYEDMYFSYSGSLLTTVSYTCSASLGLCWEEWDYWEKVSDWP